MLHSVTGALHRLQSATTSRRLLGRIAGRFLALRICLGQMIASKVNATGRWQDHFGAIGPRVQKSLEQPHPLGIGETETWLLPAAEHAAFEALVRPRSTRPCLSFNAAW